MNKIDMIAAKAKAYDGLVAFLENEKRKYIIHNDYELANYVNNYIDAARTLLKAETMHQASDRCASEDTADAGEMQKNILKMLLESRTKIKETEFLTASDMVSIFDALFYLVSRNFKEREGTE